MGVFYAYLQDEQNDHYRHLITFANREIADEWWRMISSPPSPYAANIERISPQFYTQNDQRNNNVADFFSHRRLPDAKQFHRKMFITRLHTSNGSDLSIIHPTTIIDHISGRWYFIRSKGDPWSHWYLRTDGACLVCGDSHCDAIHVSSEYRTKFCIRIRNTAEEFVMIGRDEISISASMGFSLYISDARDLKATMGHQGEIDLLFSDLKTRFITRAEKQVNGEVWEYIVPVERGRGEAWELVD